MGNPLVQSPQPHGSSTLRNAQPRSSFIADSAKVLSILDTVKQMQATLTPPLAPMLKKCEPTYCRKNFRELKRHSDSKKLKHLRMRPLITKDQMRMMAQTDSLLHESIEKFGILDAPNVSFDDLVRACTSHTASPYKNCSAEDYDAALIGYEGNFDIHKNMEEYISNGKQLDEKLPNKLLRAWALYDTTRRETTRDTDSSSLEAINHLMMKIDKLQSVGGFRVIDIFRQIDENHDGKLSGQELIAVAKRLNVEMTEKDALCLLNMLDKNIDDTVSYEELRDFMKKYKKSVDSRR